MQAPLRDGVADGAGEQARRDRVGDQMILRARVQGDGAVGVLAGLGDDEHGRIGDPGTQGPERLERTVPVQRHDHGVGQRLDREVVEVVGALHDEALVDGELLAHPFVEADQQHGQGVLRQGASSGRGSRGLSHLTGGASLVRPPR